MPVPPGAIPIQAAMRDTGRSDKGGRPAESFYQEILI
jgi:hypothetical protein